MCSSDLATMLEYITGYVMEQLFKVRYWDYSNKRFNINGYICLSSSIAWGFLTILMTEVVHQPIERLIRGIPIELLSVGVVALTLWIGCDFIQSFQTALDLREVLIRVEYAKEELQALQSRLDTRVDIAIAVIQDEIRLKREQHEVEIEARKEAFRKVLRGNPTLTSARFKDAIEDLRSRTSKM